MAFPPQFLERLRSHFLLSELIGKRMPLKKHGREYMGLCPFHGEKTPSFTVNNEKGFYHCFGCAAHGDAIEFVKRYDRLEYREAVEKLAREAGMEVPQQTRQAVERAREQQTLHTACEAACRWFEENLLDGRNFAVRDYARERGLSEATQRAFRIGYAPDSREGLKKHLMQKGFSEGQLIEVGLLARVEGNASYDRFRGRLMFPIRDVQGRVIAFGGRLLGAGVSAPGRHLPKYLNSSETPLFHKGQVLFNLDQAGKFAREKGEIVIVEGYMDVIMVAQAGMAGAVATLGTAVTPEHVQKLWHYAPEPILCLDGDGAGQRAAMRAAEMVLPLLKPGYSLRFATLPPGEDPDTLVRKGGLEALNAVLAHARGLSETLWLHYSRGVNASAEARAQLEHQLLGVCEKITNSVVKGHFQTYFRNQMWGLARVKTAPKKIRGEAVTRLRDGGEAYAKTSGQLLKILLMQPALLETLEVEEWTLRMECATPAQERLRQGLLDALHAGRATDAAGLMEYFLENGLAAAAQDLLDEAGIVVPRDVSDSVGAARRWWQQIIHSQTRAEMEAEYHALACAIQGELDETALARLLELQQLLKGLKTKRKPISGEDMAG